MNALFSTLLIAEAIPKEAPCPAFNPRLDSRIRGLASLKETNLRL